MCRDLAEEDMDGQWSVVIAYISSVKFCLLNFCFIFDCWPIFHFFPFAVRFLTK